MTPVRSTLRENMASNQDQNWIVDKEIQQGLSRRLLIYWCGTWLAIFALPICVRLLVNQMPPTQLASELLSDMWFPMMMSLLMLPILFWDNIRFSHRIAKPMALISDGMRSLSNNQSVAPIQLGEEDFCHEMAENFNRMVKTCSASPTGAQPKTAN